MEQPRHLCDRSGIQGGSHPARCIESVLTQQLPGGLRLILVDDQSPDRSGENL